MPYMHVRVALNSAIFPLYSQASGRTIIVPGMDENWDRNNAANTSPDKGVPQVFYMHNVLPIAEGFQSIGYTTVIQPFSNGTTNFDQCFTLVGANSARFLFSPATGTNYIYDPQVGTWESIDPLNALMITNTTIVTTAIINGQTYFCYSGIGVFLYDPNTKTIQQQTLISLTNSQVLGITQSNGYLIAWSNNTIVWSSLINPLDFTPNIQTGAGGGQIQQSKGNINFCLPISGGFLIYCDLNTVAASYTNNENYPFLFQEVPNSGGCQDPNQVAWQQNLSSHYVLNTNGLQQLTLNSAQAVFPEVTDFLAAQLFEDFDESALQFNTTYLSNELATRLVCVGDRFLVFSYGTFASTPSYTHAIVFDLTLGRYGKLKQTHQCFFNYFFPNLGITYQELSSTLISSFASNYVYADFFNPSTITSQKETLACLQADGTVLLVNFQLSEVAADGVFILGKYQYQRNSFIIHQRTTIESVNPGSTQTYGNLLNTPIASFSAAFTYADLGLTLNNFTPYLLPTLDGKTFLPAVGMSPIGGGTGLTTTYGLRYTALNLSLCLVGAMNLTTVEIEFTVGGFR